jgi:4-carboxymuconolactone decarboxylase
MAESELFERGLQARRDVLGAEYVDANLADADEFMMASRASGVPGRA